MKTARIFGAAILAVAVGLAAGCGGEQDETTVMNAYIAASTKVNPDFDGRPSPIVVRIYELKSRNLFDTADFYDMYSDEKAILGDEFLRRTEHQIRPGDVLPVDIELREDTRYIGVLAAYRDVNEAKWRDSVAVAAEKKFRLSINLERLTMTATVSGYEN